MNDGDKKRLKKLFDEYGTEELLNELSKLEDQKDRFERAHTVRQAEYVLQSGGAAKLHVELVRIPRS